LIGAAANADCTIWTDAAIGACTGGNGIINRCKSGADRMGRGHIGESEGSACDCCRVVDAINQYRRSLVARIRCNGKGLTGPAVDANYPIWIDASVCTGAGSNSISGEYKGGADSMRCINIGKFEGAAGLCCGVVDTVNQYSSPL